MKRDVKFGLAAAALLALPGAVLAQGTQPVLIHPAVFGTVREAQGSQLLTVTPTATCSAAGQPIAGGPCFDKVSSAIGARGRVLSLNHPAQKGDRVEGVYGRDFTLYDVIKGPHGLEARPMPLPTSNVLVPRNCFALPGEDVAYVIGVNGPDVAQESQLVVCDGGPHQPRGPYQPEGAPIPPGGQDTWHRTEMLELQGDQRYLAAPATCDPVYSIKTTYCAQPAVTFMQNNPDQKELDLIAALHPVQPGDVLTKKEIDQWVLKRKGTHGGFKADARWFDKSSMHNADGCTPVEDIGWLVEGEADGLYIVEQALNRCGAPPAPVPADVYEAYGDDYYVVDCAEHHGWRDHHGHDRDGDEGGCFADAAGYLHRTHQSSATVVVLNDRAHSDDHLYSGSYVSYDVANVYFDKDGHIQADRLDNYQPSGVYMNGCSAVPDGDPESRGFIIERSMGEQRARAYQWMNCPVY